MSTTTKTNDGVWQYFIRNRVKQTAQCNKCKKTLMSYGGSTTSLHSHLKTAHGISSSKRTATDNNSVTDETSPQPSSSKKSQITSFFTKKNDDSLAAIISRMTAKDGVPMSLFCTSIDMRKLLAAKGFQDIPRSPNTIRRTILNYAENIRDKIIFEMTCYKKNGGKFSLTLDEWTSTRNRRYMNINAHTDSPDKFWNLGLVRVTGSLPAEKCVDLILERLSVYKISLEEDVVAITTDGAAVMKKVGKLISASQQLCFAHAIQLAVLSVLYRKDTPDDEIELSDTTYETEKSDSSDSDEDDLNSNDDDYVFNIDQSSINQPIPLSHNQLTPLIAKVRKVIKIFRASPTKNDDVLQKNVKAEFGKELMLILDSKTRWNSLLLMLERFIKLKSAIQKSLIDLKSDIRFSTAEFDLLTKTVSVLMPIKCAVEAICRRDANLLTADATFKFLLNTLDKISGDGDLAWEMKNALETRIIERRTDLSNLLQYLHNGSTNSKESNIFPLIKKNVAKKLLITTINRLFNKSETQNQHIDIDHNDDNVSLDASDDDECIEIDCETFEQQMQRAIEKDTAVPVKRISTNSKSSFMENVIKRELAQFGDTGTRGEYMELCYNALKTIQPTSVESERAFSVSGNLCTKLRSRLGDKTIDELCFLRSYFKTNDI